MTPNYSIWTKYMPATKKRGAKIFAWLVKLGSPPHIDSAEQMDVYDVSEPFGAEWNHYMAATTLALDAGFAGTVQGGREKWPGNRRRWIIREKKAN